MALQSTMPVELLSGRAQADFTTDPDAWTVSGDTASIVRGAGPDGRAAAVVAAGDRVSRTIRVSRGSTELAGRRYLVRILASVLGPDTVGFVNVSCGGSSTTGRTPPDPGWHEVETVVDTERYVPGHGESSVTLTLSTRGPGKVLFSNPRLYAVPSYGVHMRFRVHQPAAGEFTARLTTIRRHRDTGHHDSTRHRYGSGVDLGRVPAGSFSDWTDLRRFLFGGRLSTATLTLLTARGGENVDPVGVEVEFAYDVHLAERGGEDAELLDLLEPDAAEEQVADVFHRESLVSRNGRFTFLLPENDVPPARFLDSVESVNHEIEERIAWTRATFSPPGHGRFQIPTGANLSNLERLLDEPTRNRELEILGRIGIRSLARNTAETTGFDEIRTRLYGPQPAVDRTYAGRLHSDEFFSPYDGNRLAEAMDRKYARLAERLAWTAGGSNRISIIELADEPGNQAPAACDLDAFRAFLKKRGVTPEHVGASSWEAVRPHGYADPVAVGLDDLPVPEGEVPDDLEQVGDTLGDLQLEEADHDGEAQDPTPEDADTLPTRRLRYYTRLFCARKTADFFKTVTAAVEKHLPGARTAVNFRSGVRRVLTPETADWFLIGRQRAVTMMWNEDWLNTYGWRRDGVELVSYYVELMRTAATRHDLPVGGFLMCFWGQATRKSYAALAHGSRYLHYWRYGPWYANYLPYSWSHNRQTVQALGKVFRDVGRLEEVLVEAKRDPAETALLVAKSDGIWGYGQAENRRVFFALLHDQVPVDLLTEAQVEEDNRLEQYRWLYVTDVTVRQKTIGRIRTWVEQGGSLWLSERSGTRNEFNEPTDILGMTSPGRESSPGNPEGIPVGKGRIWRSPVQAGAAYAADVERPRGRIQHGWNADARRRITGFALDGGVNRPVRVDRACIEAILYRHPRADVLFLVNFASEEPVESLTVTVEAGNPIASVESCEHGLLTVRQQVGRVTWTQSLDKADSVILRRVASE